jgi:dipeptide transport system substrate-binding protein
VFSFERQLKADNPWNQYVPGASWEYFSGMGFPDLFCHRGKGRRHDGPLRPEQKEAPFLANVAMRRPHHVPGIRRQARRDGNMAQLNQQPLGTAPVPIRRLQQDAVIRYKAHPDYWNGQTADRRPRLRDHHRRGGALPELQAGECHLMRSPTRRRGGNEADPT